MLEEAHAALAQRDAAQARRLALEDDAVDALYRQAARTLIKTMSLDPSVLVEATHLQWAAHNLERVADRMKNVCERVTFAVCGQTCLQHGAA